MGRSVGGVTLFGGGAGRPSSTISGYIRTPVLQEEMRDRVGGGGGADGVQGAEGQACVHVHRRAEYVSLWREEPVFPARPGKCRLRRMRRKGCLRPP